MPEKTKEYYIDCGKKCLENNLFCAAIAAFNSALSIDPDNAEAQENLTNAYNAFDIPNLSVVPKNEYTGNMELPNDVSYVLVGKSELDMLPELVGADNTPIYANEFELTRKYPVLAENMFAVDFSVCAKLKKIPSALFACSENLVCADLSGCKSLSSIDDGSFSSCVNLKSIIFPDNLEKIGELAFEFANLSELDLSHTHVSEICKGAFINNQNLHVLVFPDSLTKIDDAAFAHCYNLNKVTLTQNIQSISDDAFLNSGVKIIDAPDSVDIQMVGLIPVMKGDTLTAVQYIEWCGALNAHNRYEQALHVCDESIYKYPESYHLYFMRGSTQIDNGNYKEAISDFGKSLELQKKYPQVKCTYLDVIYYKRAICYKELEEYGHALDDSLKACKLLKYRDFNTLDFCGSMCCKLEAYKDGIKYLNKALNFCKNDVQKKDVLYKIGLCYQNMGRRDKSINYFWDSTYIAPEKNTVYDYITHGESAMFAGYPGKAVKILSDGLKIEPHNNQCLRIRARAYADYQHFDEAINDISMAISLYKTNYADDLIFRGKVYYKLGKLDEAYNDFSEAIKADPNNYCPYDRRAIINVERGNYEEAISDVNKLCELCPNDYDAYFSQILVYEQAGRYDLALKSCRAALNLRMYDPNVQYHCGVIYSAIGRDDYAIASFNAAADLDPNNPNIYIKRGDIYRKNGQYNIAIADYKKAIKQGVYSADAYFGCGVIYNSQCKYDAAIESFNRAIEFNPEMKEAYLQRGIAYIGAHYTSDAYNSLNDLSNRFPDYAEAKALFTKLDGTLEPLCKETSFNQLRNLYESTVPYTGRDNRKKQPKCFGACIQ